MSRIGILGGTFDPIHLGHLIVASYAAHELRLDRVLIMPAQTPPHKLGMSITPAEHRVEMIRLAIEPDPRLELSTLDLASREPSYTSTLLERAQAEHPGDELVFIIGADSLRDFPTWYRPDLILQRAEIAVARRPGVEIDETMLSALPGLRERTTLFTSPLIDISSTGIRQRMREGAPVTWLVPPAVEQLIIERGIYT
jgi:nicotinate-nucleotide adenylyltransferase